MDVHQALYENEYYHIYNRGNNGDNLFCKHENYNYFLKKYDKHLNDYLETFAYCLLPNHFHLLVRVKNYKDFPELKEKYDSIKKGVDQSAPEQHRELIVSEQFRKLFIGYAKAINIQEGRTGSLFQKSFKRKKVDTKEYFDHLIYYIHANPLHHGIITGDFREYPYSSYGSILSDKKSKLFRHEVLSWFGTKETFVNFHSSKQDLKKINDLVIEED